jgi:hypothetical protein
LQISPGYKIDGKDILSIGFVDAYSVALNGESPSWIPLLLLCPYRTVIKCTIGTTWDQSAVLGKSLGPLRETLNETISPCFKDGKMAFVLRQIMLFSWVPLQVEQMLSAVRRTPDVLL